MSRYSFTYASARSVVRSGQARRRIAESGSPVIAPTRSKSSGVPPCAEMTRFAVSTTKRTLSVSVPSRSQRTARGRGPRSAPTATRRGRGGGRLDRKLGLLRDSPVTRLLPHADEALELVVKGVGVLEVGVDDLEAQVPHGVLFGEPVEHHLTDAARRDLGRAALPDRRLDVVDEGVDGVRRELPRRTLADGARELATV